MKTALLFKGPAIKKLFKLRRSRKALDRMTERSWRKRYNKAPGEDIFVRRYEKMSRKYIAATRWRKARRTLNLRGFRR